MGKFWYIYYIWFLPQWNRSLLVYLYGKEIITLYKIHVHLSLLLLPKQRPVTPINYNCINLDIVNIDLLTKYININLVTNMNTPKCYVCSVTNSSIQVLVNNVMAFPSQCVHKCVSSKVAKTYSCPRRHTNDKSFCK